MKADVESRLGLVSRLELKQQAKAAVAREQIVSQEPPTPNTIAILPFSFVGATEELRPLQTALADMMITDLSVAPRALQPIERTRMQALIDEMLLSAAGFTDPSRTTQAGRLLKAENVVQGAITMAAQDQLRVTGSLLNTVQRAERAPLQGQNQVQNIFNLEKELVFRIFSALNITLTDAERQRINDNRTTNLLAFLSYGRGLESLDRGNYAEATSHFNQAASLDPQFARARAQRQESVQLQQANQVSTEEIAVGGAAETSPRMDAVSPIAATNDLLKQTAQEVNYSPGQHLTGSGNTGDGSTRNSQTRNNGQQEAQGQSSGGIQQALKAKVNITICNPTVRAC
jgi:TolB-like protein